MKGKGKAIFANLLAPGFGHLVLKKWLRGLLFFLGTLLAVAWVIASFAIFIIGAYSRAAQGEDITFNIMHIFSPLIVVFIIWIGSYVDLICFCKVEAKEKKES